MRKEVLIKKIQDAWPLNDLPFKIIDSNEGEEPELLAKEFSKKPKWNSLKPDFLDSTPDGYGTALCFFGNEAFRYYIAAFMIADINSKLNCVTPSRHLTHGLTNDTKDEKINPLRFGEKTWFNACQSKFSLFNKNQISCIIEYLKFMSDADPFNNNPTETKESISNYWKPRLLELTTTK